MRINRFEIIKILSFSQSHIATWQPLLSLYLKVKLFCWGSFDNQISGNTVSYWWIVDLSVCLKFRVGNWKKNKRKRKILYKVLQLILEIFEEAHQSCVKTLSNIYDENFFKRNHRHLTVHYFCETFHHIRLTGPSICLSA